MNTETNGITEVQKRDVAFEVLVMNKTGKTKDQIAKECGVSLQWLNHYVGKYLPQALEIRDIAAAITDDDIAKFRKSFEMRRRGRPPKGVKSIKDIVIGTMEKYKNKNKFTLENREKMIDEIMKATGHDHAIASKYFSGYKKHIGDYQE